jgi:hypothetical protein
MIVGLLNNLSKHSTANKTVDMELAPSLAEADAILAQFGYVEEELQMAA